MPRHTDHRPPPPETVRSDRPPTALLLGMGAIVLSPVLLLIATVGILWHTAGPAPSATAGGATSPADIAAAWQSPSAAPENLGNSGGDSPDASPSPAKIDVTGHCATCHGPNGEGNQELLAPRIAGQDPWYLRRQIRAFIQGWRGGPDTHPQAQAMRAMISSLSPDDVEEAIDHFAAIEPETPPDRIRGHRLRGKRLYATSCSVCHGVSGEGDPQHHMPRLNDQHGWYLHDQLMAFRNGHRGVEPEDLEGQAMAFYAKLLPSDKDALDISAWLSTAGRERYRRQREAKASAADAPPDG